MLFIEVNEAIERCVGSNPYNRIDAELQERIKTELNRMYKLGKRSSTQYWKKQINNHKSLPNGKY